MTAPRTVSVVIPTYRRPALLSTALASVAAQTYPHYEVLVCDNDNDTKTAAIVHGLGDDRFTYLGRPRNLGMFASAVDGFTRTSGDLVLKLDDDDVLRPTFLEVMAAAFDLDDRLSVACSDIELIDCSGAVLPAQTDAMRAVTGRDTLAPGLHQSFTRLAATGTLSMAAAVLRRDSVRWSQIPPEVSTSYDLHLCLEAAGEGRSMWYTSERLVQYRLHPDSDSHRGLRAQLDGASHALRHAVSSGRHDDTGSIRAAQAGIDLRLGREELLEGMRTQAMRSLLRSLGAGSRSKATGIAARACALIGLAAMPSGVRDRVLHGRRARYVDPTRLNAHL